LLLGESFSARQFRGCTPAIVISANTGTSADL
jgi:hypothetical protein